MKKVLIGCLVIILILSITGCGVKDKVKEKVGEEIAEKIVENAGGGDVEIEGEKVTITGESGEEFSFGGADWPTSALAKNIPEFRKGKVFTVLEMNDSLLIGLEEVAREDFENYLEEIKKTFTEQVYDMQSEDGVSYGAENSEGIGVMLVYTGETLNITVREAEKE
ncbi:MAG TPA: DUF6591 domain-containing protein [Oscillospiraceae bacterium]|nr:DUF6591 domain-containing protein [Oscillospiraceae bacterium]